MKGEITELAVRILDELSDSKGRNLQIERAVNEYITETINDLNGALHPDCDTGLPREMLMDSLVLGVEMAIKNDLVVD